MYIERSIHDCVIKITSLGLRQQELYFFNSLNQLQIESQQTKSHKNLRTKKNKQLYNRKVEVVKVLYVVVLKNSSNKSKFLI